MANTATGKARVSLPQSWVDIPDRGYLDKLYPTKVEVSTADAKINTKIDNITNGTTKVPNALATQVIDNVKDQSGNYIATTKWSIPAGTPTKTLITNKDWNEYTETGKYGAAQIYPWGKNAPPFTSGSTYFVNLIVINGFETGYGKSIIQIAWQNLKYEYLIRMNKKLNGKDDWTEWREIATTESTVKLARGLTTGALIGNKKVVSDNQIYCNKKCIDSGRPELQRKSLSDWLAMSVFDTYDYWTNCPNQSKMKVGDVMTFIGETTDANFNVKWYGLITNFEGDAIYTKAIGVDFEEKRIANLTTLQTYNQGLTTEA